MERALFPAYIPLVIPSSPAAPGPAMLQRTLAPKPSPARAPSPLNPAFAPRPFAARTAPGAGHTGAAPGSPATAATGGRPLPEAVRRPMEAALGHDFASVRVHADDARAPRIGALAYARGEHLHFAPGAWRPQSAGGRAVLGHELAHVVQQRERRVRPTRPGTLPVNDDPRLEREADAAGAHAARGAASAHGAAALMAAPVAKAAPAASTGPVQMTPFWKKALAGAGVAAAGAVAAATLPWWGTAALVGGGLAAYKGYQKYRKSGTGRAQANLSELHDIHQSLGASGANPLLHNVLTETLGNTGTFTGVASVRGGSTHPKGETTRHTHGTSYTARLDDSIQDPHQRRSYLLHELTHVSADRRYSFNDPGRLQFTNTPYHGASDIAAGQNKMVREQQIQQGAVQGQALAQNDPHLPPGERDYIHGRLKYIADNPGFEYDTVANELLLYSHTKGLPAHSPTVQHIHAIAQDAYTRRNTAYARTG